MKEDSYVMPVAHGNQYDATGSSSQEENILSKLEMLKESLFFAIANEQLFLRYHPVIGLQTDKIVGMDALLRWEHPELGSLSPRWFIPIAEESGFILDIGEWLLQKVCMDIRTWLDSDAITAVNTRIAINLSPKQFRDPNLANRVKNALSAAGIAPGMLSLKLTEATLMYDLTSSETTVRQLKELGLDLALDDFGTGFFPLHYLQRFPFDRVSLGPSLIQDILTNSNDTAMLRNVISLAHSYGIKVGANRVETEAQCTLLRQKMCDEMPSLAFSQAVPASDVLALLSQGDTLKATGLDSPRPQRVLLLVDDEANILGSLKRLLRRENYQILTAGGGQEGLALLAQHKVDVIVSDQRMPGMTGVEFFREAKVLYPDTMRIVLSGYTELQSVTDAINEGAVYKFITKPWDDAQLCGHIEEAFRCKEMFDENVRLNFQIRNANQELAIANIRLEEVLQQQQQQIVRNETSLEIAREALQHIPLPVIGLGDDNIIVFLNVAAQTLFKHSSITLGDDAGKIVSGSNNALIDEICDVENSNDCIVVINGVSFQISARKMGGKSLSRGTLLTFSAYEKNHD